MCKIIIGEWKELSATHAAEMLKGDFPKCGVKYTSKYGAGLVLVERGISFDLLIEKAEAAATKEDISYVFKVPSWVSAVFGHAPLLTDAV